MTAGIMRQAIAQSWVCSFWTVDGWLSFVDCFLVLWTHTLSPYREGRELPLNLIPSSGSLWSNSSLKLCIWLLRCLKVTLQTSTDKSGNIFHSIFISMGGLRDSVKHAQKGSEDLHWLARKFHTNFLPGHANYITIFIYRSNYMTLPSKFFPTLIWNIELSHLCLWPKQSLVPTSHHLDQTWKNVLPFWAPELTEQNSSTDLRPEIRYTEGIIGIEGVIEI